MPGSMPAATLKHAASTDGIDIGWREYGKGAPAIVLIHGWAADSTVWRAQLSALAARYHVVALDLCGQGSSGAGRERWSLPLFAQDVAAVVAQLPDAHIVLVGQGMGGPVALQAAPLVGTRLQGIIGVETFRTIGLAPPLPSQIDHALDPFRADFTGTVRRFVTGTLFHAQADATVVSAVVEMMMRTPAEQGVATLAELNRFDYGSALAAVKVPIVAIDSDLGGAIDEARERHFAPQLRIITLQGDDSFPMLTDTRRFNTTLMQAVDSLARR